MSDEQPQELPDTDDTQNEASASPGRMLQAGRKKQGLSQQQVADKLFLKASQIDDLENDRIDENTSVTFTRGYIRNYAKQLGLDQEAVITEFDRLHTSAKQPAKLQSFSRRVAKQTHDDRWMMVTYAIVLLLLAGVVAWWYQQSGSETLVEESAVSTDVADAGSQGAPNTAGSRQSQPDVVSDNTTDSAERETASALTAPAQDSLRDTARTEDTPQQQPAARQSDPVPQSTAQTAAIEPRAQRGAGEGSDPVAESQSDSELPPPSTASTENTSASPGTAINMVFRFADDCWVNIEDSTGEAIAYGIKQAGRVMEISGVPPVEVTLGAPDNVAITVDGEAVDMSVFPGGRTARFSLPIQE